MISGNTMQIFILVQSSILSETVRQSIGDCDITKSRKSHQEFFLRSINAL